MDEETEELRVRWHPTTLVESSKVPWWSIGRERWFDFRRFLRRWPNPRLSAATANPVRERRGQTRSSLGSPQEGNLVYLGRHPETCPAISKWSSALDHINALDDRCRSNRTLREPGDDSTRNVCRWPTTRWSHLEYCSVARRREEYVREREREKVGRSSSLLPIGDIRVDLEPFPRWRRSLRSFSPTISLVLTVEPSLEDLSLASFVASDRVRWRGIERVRVQATVFYNSNEDLRSTRIGFVTADEKQFDPTIVCNVEWEHRPRSSSFERRSTWITDRSKSSRVSDLFAEEKMEKKLVTMNNFTFASWFIDSNRKVMSSHSLVTWTQGLVWPQGRK